MNDTQITVSKIVVAGEPEAVYNVTMEETQAGDIAEVLQTALDQISGIDPEVRESVAEYLDQFNAVATRI